MNLTFDVLINGFINNKIGIAENFLSKSLASHLKENLTRLYEDEQLLDAGTGNNTHAAHNKSFRGDKIYWLDRAHNDKYENKFFDLLDNFISHLNSTCYTSIRSYEFHYTMYEKESFYKKHIDQFQNNDSRKYSMVIYLNEDWQEGDGGELCIHHGDKVEHISPNSGKTVFFKSSELSHEVLRTRKKRMSITGWLKN